MEVSKETFSTLTGISPLSNIAPTILLTPPSLQYITRTLMQGGIHDEISKTVLILQELTADPQNRQAIGSTDGLVEALIHVIQQPHGLKATKAAITILYNLARDKPLRLRLVKAGAVPALLEILPESDKGVCERALAVLDVLCNSAEGRGAAYEHALTVPVVVKKILRVSNLATDFAVSILFTLCRHSSNGHVMVDGLQAGAFEKLLVVLQLGCSENSRKRTTQLLKLFNHYSQGWKCINSSHFEGAKRSLFCS